MIGYLDALEVALQGVHSATRGRFLRLTFTGSRDWPVEHAPVLEGMFQLVQQHYARRVRLAHGKARGADLLADKLGRRHGWQIMPYPVSSREWNTYGGYAGHQRNARMLETEAPDLVIALTWRRSRGATGCADNATARGITVVRVDDELALLPRVRATL